MQISTLSDTAPGARSQAANAPVLPTQHRMPFFLVTGLFFLWGMSNNLTDILVQQFKKSFELSPLEAQLVQTAVFFGYFCMAIPAALFMRRYGYKAGILVGLCLFGTGMLLFWPAAIIGQYVPFLLALFAVGCGSAILETAANPFIAQFGAPETAAQRLNVSQAFNPPGTIAGVLVGTFFIFSGVELTTPQVNLMKTAGTYTRYLHTEIMRVVPTYLVLGALVLGWAAWIAMTRFPVIKSEQELPGEKARFTDLLRHRGLWLAVLAEFCYCGTQTSTWSTVIPYVKQYTTISERGAALFLTGNLIALAIGRFVSTALMRWFSPAKMVGVYATINMALIAFAIVRPGLGGAISIMLTSFFMSIMFPTIFALGVKGLGRNTQLGGSIIVMSVVGGAIIPPLVGLVARNTGAYAMGYVVLLGGYLVIAAYGLFGAEGRASVAAVEAAPLI